MISKGIYIIQITYLHNIQIAYFVCLLKIRKVLFNDDLSTYFNFLNLFCIFLFKKQLYKELYLILYDHIYGYRLHLKFHNMLYKVNMLLHFL